MTTLSRVLEILRLDVVVRHTFLCSMALGGLAGSPAHAADASGKGPVASFIKGEVEAGPLVDGATPVAFTRVKRNQEIAPGSVVKTGEDARAELKFSDGSIVRVGPSSQLKVAGAGFNGKTKEVQVEATLVAGKAWAKVAKLVGDDAKFQVKTQNAVAGVRGTIFRVNIDKDEATVVKVYNGAVAVSNSPFFDNSQKDGPQGPIASDRKQIAAPMAEVSKDVFEKILGKMMEVRVGANGKISEPAAFTKEGDTQEDPEWVRWNEERDGGKARSE